MLEGDARKRDVSGRESRINAICDMIHKVMRASKINRREVRVYRSYIVSVSYMYDESIARIAIQRK